VWNKWHKWWLEEAENGKTPVYFFRFEDMIKNPEYENEKLMQFVLGIKGSMEGTVA
jgi:deferrochelatase/peroxidase EfeB